MSGGQEDALISQFLQTPICGVIEIGEKDEQVKVITVPFDIFD